MESKKRVDKFWICLKCSEIGKWIKPNFTVTVRKGLCGHCDHPEEVFLIPVDDFTQFKKEKDL